jgi:hypothetical protein
MSCRKNRREGAQFTPGQNVDAPFVLCANQIGSRQPSGVSPGKNVDSN